MSIKRQETKTLITKPNNNSANAIAPNIIYGCFGGCVGTYCYMSRFNGKRVFVNTNVDDIVSSVFKWADTYKKEPDQQDPVYKMVDVACNTDLVLMQKHLPMPLEQYLKMYDDHSEVNTTMATKYPGLLKLDVNHFDKKPRVRVSLMPQSYSDILEPKMQSIESRIRDIDRLKKLAKTEEEPVAENARTDAEEEGYEDGFKDAKDDMKDAMSKMKVSELKAKIKEDILSVLSEAEEEVDVDIDVEDEVEVDAEADDIEIERKGVKAKVEVGLSPEEEIVQDSLKAAMDAANELGNQKLADQIGNTITFFTREFVVGNNTD